MKEMFNPLAAVPPTRDGVSPSCVVLPPGSWRTIAEFLVERFSSIAPAIWYARLESGDVIDDRGVPIDLQRPYQRGSKVYYYRALEAEPRIPFQETVHFQD